MCVHVCMGVHVCIYVYVCKSIYYFVRWKQNQNFSDFLFIYFLVFITNFWEFLFACQQWYSVDLAMQSLGMAALRLQEILRGGLLFHY